MRCKRCQEETDIVVTNIDELMRKLTIVKEAYKLIREYLEKEKGFIFKEVWVEGDKDIGVKVFISYERDNR